MEILSPINATTLTVNEIVTTGGEPIPVSMDAVTVANFPDFPATQTVNGTVAISGTVPVSFTQTGLTDAQLRATALPVSLASVPSHPVTISGTVPVSGTFWQATQPVSLASVPTHAVTLASTTITNFPATQAVSGTVAISGTVPVSFTQTGLTDTQLRATPLSVNLQSGTNVVGRVAGTAATANPAAAANAASANVMTDKLGRLVTVSSHVRDLQDSSFVTLTNTTASATLIAATAGVFNDIVGLIITNSSSTIGTWVEILDAAIVKLRVWIPPGGGGPINLAIPLKQAGVNAAWNARTVTATTEVTVCALSVRNI